MDNEIVSIVFTKLSLTYGRDFTSRWEGMDMRDVRADWAHELSGFRGNPQAILYALKHLPPSKPPTVLEFKAICYRAPEQVLPRLERPPVNTALARKAIAEARAIMTKVTRK